MTKYLITASLLNSYQYYIQDEFKSPADSRADFLKTLSRERFEPNEAMQKGIDFEDDLMQVSLDLRGFENYLSSNSNNFETKPFSRDIILHELGAIVEGGLWQESVKKEITVGNQEFLLYGRMDVIKRDTIYDIKFTSNYELGKFMNSSQHRIYLYCLGLPKFQYLISDGKEYWIEDYHNHEGIEDELKGMISDFMSYLENDKEAKEMFLTNWESK
jgi:hypothetical protein